MIAKESSVVDIGCDHGFLDIYLTKYKCCNCIASDVSLKVLENTKSNIDKYGLTGKIKIICSNGLENIKIKKEDIVVISGMGTSTIIDILKNNQINIINNLIIQSNNDIEILRKKVVKLGFYVFLEKIVNEKNKNYIIIYFKRGYKKYSNYDYLFGPIARTNPENILYFNNLYKKHKNILDKIPSKYILKKIEKYIYLKKIKKFTCMKF